MSKYGPLKQFLDRVPPSVRETTLTFAEMEHILGFTLPQSALIHRPWWSNPTTGDHPHAQAWLAAGWVVAMVDQGRRSVQFRRTGPGGTTHTAVATASATSCPREYGARSEIAATIGSTRFLLGLGFEEAGEWLLANGSPRFVLARHGDARNILYAFVAQDGVRYIGKSSQTLSGRMNGYREPGSSQYTNIRVNGHILGLLRKDLPVRILVFVQDEEMLYRGVPINLAAGLEDNLIARVAPQWNLRT